MADEIGRQADVGGVEWVPLSHAIGSRTRAKGTAERRAKGFFSAHRRRFEAGCWEASTCAVATDRWQRMGVRRCTTARHTPECVDCEGLKFSTALPRPNPRLACVVIAPSDGLAFSPDSSSLP